MLCRCRLRKHVALIAIVEEDLHHEIVGGGRYVVALLLMVLVRPRVCVKITARIS